MVKAARAFGRTEGNMINYSNIMHAGDPGFMIRSSRGYLGLGLAW